MSSGNQYLVDLTDVLATWRVSLVAFAVAVFLGGLWVGVQWGQRRERNQWVEVDEYGRVIEERVTEEHRSLGLPDATVELVEASDPPIPRDFDRRGLDQTATVARQQLVEYSVGHDAPDTSIDVMMIGQRIDDWAANGRIPVVPADLGPRFVARQVGRIHQVGCVYAPKATAAAYTFDTREAADAHATERAMQWCRQCG